MAKLKSCCSQMCHHSVPADNRVFDIFNFFNGTLIYVKHNPLNHIISIKFDSEKIRLLFHRGVPNIPIYFCRTCHCIWCTHLYNRRIIVSYVIIYMAKRAIVSQFTLQSHHCIMYSFTLRGASLYHIYSYTLKNVALYHTYRFTLRNVPLYHL